MEKLFLICDAVGSAKLEILQNESSGSRNSGARFRGKFQEANVRNKNNRMYSYDILERESNRLQEVIGERRLFGELDHPTDSIIHLENASHLITKLWWEGMTLMGEGEILATPAGKILETIIRSEIPVGISSRGVGTGKTSTEGVMLIDPNFRLITFDVVADPSTPKAFAGPIPIREKTRAESVSVQTKTTTTTIPKKSTKTEHTCIDTNAINEEFLVSYLRNAFRSKLDK